MVKIKEVFSSFSADDLEEEKEFYSVILGLKVNQDEMGLRLNLPSGAKVFVYQKDNHEPATFTVLNLEVEGVETAVKELKNKGVVFEQYENITDEDGIARGFTGDNGPDIAWFKDPAGNIISVLEGTNK